VDIRELLAIHKPTIIDQKYTVNSPLGSISVFWGQVGQATKKPYGYGLLYTHFPDKDSWNIYHGLFRKKSPLFQSG